MNAKLTTLTALVAVAAAFASPAFAKEATPDGFAAVGQVGIVDKAETRLFHQRADAGCEDAVVVGDQDERSVVHGAQSYRRATWAMWLGRPAREAPRHVLADADDHGPSHSMGT